MPCSGPGGLGASEETGWSWWEGIDGLRRGRGHSGVTVSSGAGTEGRAPASEHRVLGRLGTPGPGQLTEGLRPRDTPQLRSGPSPSSGRALALMGLLGQRQRWPPRRRAAQALPPGGPLFPKLPAGPWAGPPATCSLHPAPHALLALSLGSEWAAEAKARSGQSCCASLEAIWPGAWALGYPPHWLSDCPLPAPCTGLHGGDRRPSRMGGCPWEKDGGF